MNTVRLLLASIALLLAPAVFGQMFDYGDMSWFGVVATPASAGSFDPEQVPGLVLRFEGDNGPLTDGGTPNLVLCWTNIATANFNGATYNLTNSAPTKRPYLTNNASLWNNKPSVWFDLTDDFLTNTMAAVSQPTTWFILGYVKHAYGSTAQIFDCIGTDRQQMYYTTDPYIAIKAGTELHQNKSSMVSSPTLIEITFDTTSTLITNGVATGISGSAGTLGVGRIVLSIYQNTTGYPAGLDTPCILLYGANVSSDNRALIRQWFRTKYNAY